MKSKNQRRRDLTLQIFTWSIAGALLGSNNPFPTAFNNAFPVFVEMGRVVAEVADLQTPTPTSPPFECPRALPMRIFIGDYVEVTDSLHFRFSPEITAENILLTHLRGTQLEVVGGPVCAGNESTDYVWWQLQTRTGEIGWSAEAEALKNFYFLKPINKSFNDEIEVTTATLTLMPTATRTAVPTMTPTPTSTPILLPTQTTIAETHTPPQKKIFRI
jgi:hypothetical protein